MSAALITGAIALAYREGESWISLVDEERESYLARVRCVLVALREPTPEMCASGHMAMETATGCQNDDPVVPPIWSAMIDAALK